MHKDVNIDEMSDSDILFEMQYWEAHDYQVYLEFIRVVGLNRVKQLRDRGLLRGATDVGIVQGYSEGEAK